MKYKLLWICRFLVGCLFIFSGLIKANDPTGFGIKLEEYYDVFAQHWVWTSFFFKSSLLIETVNIQAALICIAEVALGIALLLGIRGKLVSWLLLLMIVFFTWLTGYSAITGAVTDCGCFGDFIKLTPTQSFYKDIVLLLLIVVIFILKKHIKPLFKIFPSTIIFLLVTAFTTWVAFYVLRHDVFLDWRPYAVGENISKNMTIPPNADKGEIEMIYVYKNSKTQEVKEVKTLSSDPKSLEALNAFSTDSTWKYVERKDNSIREAFKPKISDFAVNDEDGNDITEKILSSKDYQIMIVAPNFKDTHIDGWQKINALQKVAEQEGIFTFALVADSRTEIEKFRHANNTAFPFYTGDYKVCLTIMRSNPGVVILKEGTVIAKYPWRNVPNFSDIKKEHFPDRVPKKLRKETDELFVPGDDVTELLAQNEKPYDQFFIKDSTDTDITTQLINDSSSVYIVILADMSLDKLTPESWNALFPLMQKIDASGSKYFIISGADPSLLQQMKDAVQLSYNYYSADNYMLAKIMKENTGIIVLKNGIVMHKYVQGALPNDDEILLK